jgi:hypothetical protein
MFWCWIVNHATALSVVVTAAATIAVAAFTCCLYRATNRLWEAGGEQIKVATKAANAAETAAKTLVDNERPWVGPRTVACAPPLSAGNDIAKSVCVVIVNTGRMPAQKMRARFEGYIRDKDVLPPELDTTLTPAKALFPGINDYYYPFRDYRGPLSSTDYDGIVGGGRIAWVVGRIDYLDSRGDPHHSTVRTQWDCDRQAFVPSDTGNEAT